MLRKACGDRKGFTLIEIMLVVVIIGILASTVLPRLTGRTEKARLNRAKVDIANIALALKLYELDKGTFPASLSELQTGGSESYLEKEPVDPWGRSYQYAYPGQRNPVSFDLFSFGKDGVESADDVAN